VTFIVQRLSAPYITLVGSVVSWGEVTGAGGYSVYVRIGGTQVSRVELGSDARSFDLAGLGLNADNYIVTVVALGVTGQSLNSLASNWVLFGISAGDFSISFADFVDMAPDIPIIGPTINFTGVGAHLTVTNPGQYDPGSIRWLFQGTQITGTMVSGIHGQTLTLGPLIHGNLFGVGTHFLTVEVSLNGVPYSRRIAFTVER